MMRTRTLWILLVVLVAGALLAGCAAKQQETEQAPVDSTAMKMAEQARADSIAQAREQARQDSIAAAQAEEQRRLEAERLEAQRKAAEEKAAKESIQTIYFDFDKSALTEAARTTLQQNAELIRKYPDWKVVVEGHTDERGSTEYNLALGERRAASVKDYYVNYGIAADRIEVVSYGEERPAVEGHNEKAWSQNRRAVTVVK